MTDDKKAPGEAEPFDWDQALSEWEGGSFKPEVAKEIVSHDPPRAEPPAPPPRPLYRPPTDLMQKGPAQRPPPPTTAPRPRGGSLDDPRRWVAIADARSCPVRHRRRRARLRRRASSTRTTTTPANRRSSRPCPRSFCATCRRLRRPCRVRSRRAPFLRRGLRPVPSPLPRLGPALRCLRDVRTSPSNSPRFALSRRRCPRPTRLSRPWRRRRGLPPSLQSKSRTRTATRTARPTRSRNHPNLLGRLFSRPSLRCSPSEPVPPGLRARPGRGRTRRPPAPG